MMDSITNPLSEPLSLAEPGPQLQEWSRPQLEHIEGRGVSVAFLRHITRTKLTEDAARQATEEAITWLGGRVRAVKQEMKLGWAARQGAQTADLLQYLFEAYDSAVDPALTREEYMKRLRGHGLAAQRRSIASTRGGLGAQEAFSAVVAHGPMLPSRRWSGRHLDSRRGPV